MARFAIEYSETFSNVYFVEAETFDEGVEKIDKAISEDEIDGPEECSDCEYADVTQEYEHELEEDDCLDIE